MLISTDVKAIANAIDRHAMAVHRLAAAVEKIAIVDVPPPEACTHENRTPLPGVMGQLPQEQCDDCGAIIET